MKKDEYEQTIRHLCHLWRRHCGHSSTPTQALSFSEFYSWVEQKRSSYLKFRTTTSVRYDVELWFDQEFGLTGLR
jgi:hypothetical protein